MNTYWANEQARQHIEQLRREATGDVLVRGARADGDGSDGTAGTTGRTPIREIANGLARRAWWRTRVAVP